MEMTVSNLEPLQGVYSGRTKAIQIPRLRSTKWLLELSNKVCIEAGYGYLPTVSKTESIHGP